MLGLNELAKDVGKGLILRVARGDDDVAQHTAQHTGDGDSPL